MRRRTAAWNACCGPCAARRLTCRCFGCSASRSMRLSTDGSCSAVVPRRSISTAWGRFTAATRPRCSIRRRRCASSRRMSRASARRRLDLTIKYIRPLLPGMDTLRCEGEVVSAGKRIGVTEARIVDDAGKIYAYAVSTCLKIPCAHRSRPSPPARAAAPCPKSRSARRAPWRSLSVMPRISP